MIESVIIAYTSLVDTIANGTSAAISLVTTHNYYKLIDMQHLI